jgi:GNAT superfamily N-acetyltransferase
MSNDFKLPPRTCVRHNLSSNDVCELVRLHGILYRAECGWDESFENYVAEPLTEFAKSKSHRERIWLVENDGKLAGSIAIVESNCELAQVRWLLLTPEIRGLGIGKWLIDQAIQFCRDCDYSAVFLWTERRLENAARLYGSFGFELTEEATASLWGSIVTEQRYELRL